MIASVCVRLGLVNVAVTSTVPSIIEQFRELYRDDVGKDDTRPTIKLDVRARRTLRGAIYDIWSDGERLTEGCASREVVPHLEWGVNRRLVMTCDHCFVVHAAALARDGQGVAFVAPSGSGKSTLALTLVARGWSYLCDEFALIDAETGWLHPFPKAICLKEGAFACAEELGIGLSGAPRFVKACKGEVAYVRPGDVRPRAIREAVPLRHIVFPTYLACDDPRLSQITSGRAAFLLAANTMNPGAFGGSLVPRLVALAERVPAVTLEAGRLDRTADLLDELVEHPPLAGLQRDVAKQAIESV